MGTPARPKPAKYFIAFLVSDLTLLAGVEAEIAAALGAIDARAAIAEWQESKFYAAEMGANLWRGFWALQNLRGPEEIAATKLETQIIENKFREPSSGGRRVNLDPGYLDTLKAVLASTKNAQQRIYLHSGIYAEATLFYHHGGFHGAPYTYPDYVTPPAREFFSNLRSIYLDQLRRIGDDSSTH